MHISLRPNSRQIPSNIEYTANKSYNDLMYGYLQSISLPGSDGIRYVMASDASAVKLGEALGITRQTASKQLKGLQDLMLVSEKKKGRYDLTFIGEEYAYLVPNDVLVRLVSTKTRYVVSMYVFFCMLSYQRNIIEYALNAVKTYIGIATHTYSNSHIVTDGLDIISNLGLLEHTEVRKQENGQWKVQKLVRNVVNFI